MIFFVYYDMRSVSIDVRLFLIIVVLLRGLCSLGLLIWESEFGCWSLLYDGGGLLFRWYNTAECMNMYVEGHSCWLVFLFYLLNRHRLISFLILLNNSWRKVFSFRVADRSSILFYIYINKLNKNIISLSINIIQ